MRIFLFLIIVLNMYELHSQTYLLINNKFPRTDETGKIVDAHDGRIIQFGKTFYWYGTKYSNTNGFTSSNTYVCYSSKDLNHWKYEGELLENKVTGVYYRPHVVYNESTKKYVLWYNWYPKLWEGQFGVAISNSPTGPFKIINDNVKVKHSNLGVGDLGIFIDENKKGYISYNTIQNHKVSVEELDSTYTSSTLKGSEFIAQHCEAGSMFKRNNIYYLLTDYTCCFCSQGSGAQVFTASNPLGPYSYRQNINRYPGKEAAVLNDDMIHGNSYETFSLTGNNAVEFWISNDSSISELQIYQFTGDRKGQCGEIGNPNVHEPIIDVSFKIQYYSDGEWKNVIPSISNIENSSMIKQYNFKIQINQADRLRISPVFMDSTSNFHLSEVRIPGKIIQSAFTLSKKQGKPIIPAQQSFIMEIRTKQGIRHSWIGDLWGSASDNIKGHDYQFWSKPLEFYENGDIKPIEWIDSWSLVIE